MKLENIFRKTPKAHATEQQLYNYNFPHFVAERVDIFFRPGKPLRKS